MKDEGGGMKDDGNASASSFIPHRSSLMHYGFAT
jgi:hypothetical protein